MWLYTSALLIASSLHDPSVLSVMSKEHDGDRFSDSFRRAVYLVPDESLKEIRHVGGIPDVTMRRKVLNDGARFAAIHQLDATRAPAWNPFSVGDRLKNRSPTGWRSDTGWLRVDALMQHLQVGLFSSEGTHSENRSKAKSQLCMWLRNEIS